MDVSLYSLCMTAVQDNAIAGTLVNLDNVPSRIRQSIFANIQSFITSGEDRTDSDSVPCLRRGEFFRDFEHFEVIDAIDCRQYLRFLSTILSEIERVDSRLGRTLVSLRLRVCVIYESIYEPIGKSFKDGMSSSNLIGVYRLIAACRDLRRLDIQVRQNCHCCQRVSSDWCSSENLNLWDELSQALAIGGDDRTPLEELTLRDFIDEYFGRNLSAFESLRFLSLRSCRLSRRIWWRLLASCRKTLLNLTLRSSLIYDFSTEPPCDGVELTTLNSLLIDNSQWYYADQFLVSSETLGRVRRGRVCVWEDSAVDLEPIGVRLSPETEVAYKLKFKSIFDGLSSAFDIFGRRLVELHITTIVYFPEPERFDDLIGRLKSIRVLIMRFCGSTVECRKGDRFLHRFLSDPDRGATLRRLQIRWNLTEPTIRLVFRHCANLEFLYLCPYLHLDHDTPDITDEDLEIWAINGAKPKAVHLGFCANFTVDGVNRLLRNCGNDLKASFLDERRDFVPKIDNLLNDVQVDLSW